MRVLCAPSPTRAVVTRASVFAMVPSDPTGSQRSASFHPGKKRGYVVVDVPEAIWSGPRPSTRTALLGSYTRTHQMGQAGNFPGTAGMEASHRWNVFSCTRTLPNQVKFGARVQPTANALQMELWITNGTDKTLTGTGCTKLRDAQICTRFQPVDNREQPAVESLCSPPQSSGQSLADSLPGSTAYDPGVIRSAPVCTATRSFPIANLEKPSNSKAGSLFTKGPILKKKFERIRQLGWINKP